MSAALLNKVGENRSLALLENMGSTLREQIVFEQRTDGGFIGHFPSMEQRTLDQICRANFTDAAQRYFAREAKSVQPNQQKAIVSCALALVPQTWTHIEDRCETNHRIWVGTPKNWTCHKLRESFSSAPIGINAPFWPMT